jgi:hypothetical protein
LGSTALVLARLLDCQLPDAVVVSEVPRSESDQQHRGVTGRPVSSRVADSSRNMSATWLNATHSASSAVGPAQVESHVQVRLESRLEQGYSPAASTGAILQTRTFGTVRLAAGRRRLQRVARTKKRTYIFRI